MTREQLTAPLEGANLVPTAPFPREFDGCATFSSDDGSCSQRCSFNGRELEAMRAWGSSNSQSNNSDGNNRNSTTSNTGRDASTSRKHHIWDDAPAPPALELSLSPQPSIGLPTSVTHSRPSGKFTSDGSPAQPSASHSHSPPPILSSSSSSVMYKAMMSIAHQQRLIPSQYTSSQDWKFSGVHTQNTPEQATEAYWATEEGRCRTAQSSPRGAVQPQAGVWRNLPRSSTSLLLQSPPHTAPANMQRTRLGNALCQSRTAPAKPSPYASPPSMAPSAMQPGAGPTWGRAASPQRECTGAAAAAPTNAAAAGPFRSTVKTPLSFLPFATLELNPPRFRLPVTPLPRQAGLSGNFIRAQARQQEQGQHLSAALDSKAAPGIRGFGCGTSKVAAAREQGQRQLRASPSSPSAPSGAPRMYTRQGSPGQASPHTAREKRPEEPASCTRGSHVSIPTRTAGVSVALEASTPKALSAFGPWQSMNLRLCGQASDLHASQAAPPTSTLLHPSQKKADHPRFIRPGCFGVDAKNS